MRSPWIDLLFLHGHVTSNTLAWLPDAPPSECEQKPVEVDVKYLPLPIKPRDGSACCA